MNPKVVLISGSSKGIGRYLVEYYCEKGFVVYGCSRSNSDFEHDNYKHFLVDVSIEAEVNQLFRLIKKEGKGIDILINNAAINPAIISAALLNTQMIEKAYSVNVFGVMNMSKNAVRLMLRKKEGRIINIGSMATRHEVPGEALYTSCKAAINAYSRVLAKEVSKSNITVNVVAPSVVKTELSEKIDKVALQEVLNRNAINTYGEMSDISNLIDLLIKDESKSITGQIIYLGGV